MLRVAVPNKGVLSETAVQMLSEAGYVIRRDPKQLVVFDEPNHAEFFYLRPRDIATYVGSGALDVGITGRDMLLDSGSTATEVATLDFGASTFRFAGPAGRFSVGRGPGRGPGRHELPRVWSRATSTRIGITVKLVTLDGAVESAVRLGCRGCRRRRRLHRHHPAPAEPGDLRPVDPRVRRPC